MYHPGGRLRAGYMGRNAPPGHCAPTSHSYGRGGVPLSIEGKKKSLGEVLYFLRNQSAGNVPEWNPPAPTHF